MPGLWDCHVHFFGCSKIAAELNKGKEPLDIVATTPSPLVIGRSTKQLLTAIDYGITSVREVGGYGLYLKQLINEGSIIGPNIYSAGKFLSIIGGHTDFHQFPLKYCCHLSESDNITFLVTGNDECLKAVRRNIRNGADLIKCHVTGGAASINDKLESRQFSDSEIKTIVEESARNGMIVAAHCHGRNGIEAAIKNGVYTIEHGSWLDESLAKKMKEKGCVYVPTRYIVEYCAETVLSDPFINPKTKEKIEQCTSHNRNALKVAIKNDLKIAMGTDMGVWDNWGDNSKELQLFVEGGMNELDAIQCGTANGPLTLGKFKDIKSGQIKKGYDADFIALTKNPLKNIKILQNSSNIVVVWKGGKILKNKW
eukprot:98529_1